LTGTIDQAVRGDLRARQYCVSLRFPRGVVFIDRGEDRIVIDRTPICRFGVSRADATGVEAATAASLTSMFIGLVPTEGVTITGDSGAGKYGKSSKPVAVKRGKVLLVRRRRDRLRMFPGGPLWGDSSGFFVQVLLPTLEYAI
jgi:hypothetical protein